MLYQDIKTYVIRCDVRLVLKAVRHKPYCDFQFLPVSTHYWKNLSKNFMTSLPIPTDWKDDNYNMILVIVDHLTKMIHYELVKTMIDAADLAEVIIDMVVRHHGLLKSIISDEDLIFTIKFWSSLCYFPDIKRQLFTIFYQQTNDQTRRQNSTMETYLWAFINWE